MQKLFLTFDLFSQSPSLKINGATRTSTNFGALIGFITLILLLSGISLILSDYFQGLSYKVNSLIDNSAIPNIDLKRMKIGFHFINKRLQEFENGEKIFSIKARFWDFKFPENLLLPKVTSEEIKVIGCDQYKYKDSFTEKYINQMNSPYKDLFCLDMENLKTNLTGVYSTLGK